MHLFIYLWTYLFIHFTRFPRHSYFPQTALISPCSRGGICFLWSWNWHFIRNSLDELQPCEICGRQNWQGDRFFSEYFRFPLSVLFHQNSVLILLICCSYQKEKQAKQRTFVKAECFWKLVSFGYRRTFTSPGFQRINLQITSSYSQFLTEMAARMSRVLSSRR